MNKATKNKIKHLFGISAGDGSVFEEAFLNEKDATKRAVNYLRDNYNKEVFVIKFQPVKRITLDCKVENI